MHNCAALRDETSFSSLSSPRCTVHDMPHVIVALDWNSAEVLVVQERSKRVPPGLSLRRAYPEREPRHTLVPDLPHQLHRVDVGDVAAVLCLGADLIPAAARAWSRGRPRPSGRC